MLLDELKSMQVQMEGEIKNATTLKEINDIKVKVFGKSGLLTSLSRGMRDLSAEERPKVGALINEVRNAIEVEMAQKQVQIEQAQLLAKLENEKIDITEPAQGLHKGALHPIPSVIDRLCDICVELGFSVVEGPEVESDYYNFEAMNIPKNHPSRDMQDTFFINDNILLRSQTSAVQAREMEIKKPPFKIICPGKTYRNDSDSTHSPVFHQLEGLVIDENVSMADLKSMLTIIMKRLFGEDTEIRFRPSFFPFTEPSIEVDVSCPTCHGRGCSLCKGTGMLELLGAGIVNPKVLEMSGIDSKKYRGFAFGFGLDRTAMILNGIGNIKYLYKNDKRFLEQMK
ncbi:MAG: phenylalanine--tRNA ligase subunit alpha [Clostridia bacterium]|nr:phenylalanine--tRNA ligase subunit alpha [Clostridia bacterium]MBQ8792270.1 phenylalanine--tRNA ligase subunit alpha [Clostridia bacterium]